jgi:hypothetical protein
MKRIIATLTILGLFFAALSLSAAEVLKEIAFERGQNSSTMHGSVVRGDRDVYLLRVRAGQTMSAKVAALENNVAFSIYEPNASEAIPGTQEENDLTSWSGNLSKSGAYRIVVGGTRGNSTYTLQVSVK